MQAGHSGVAPAIMTPPAGLDAVRHIPIREPPIRTPRTRQQPPRVIPHHGCARPPVDRAGERERALLSRALHAVDRVEAPCRLGLARHPESDQQTGEHDPLVTQLDDHGVRADATCSLDERGWALERRASQALVGELTQSDAECILDQDDSLRLAILAAQQYSLSAATALLHAVASVDRENSFGDTPLFVAVPSGRGQQRTPPTWLGLAHSHSKEVAGMATPAMPIECSGKSGAPGTGP